MGDVPSPCTFSDAGQAQFAQALVDATPASDRKPRQKTQHRRGHHARPKNRYRHMGEDAAHKGQVCQPRGRRLRLGLQGLPASAVGPGVRRRRPARCEALGDLVRLRHRGHLALGAHTRLALRLSPRAWASTPGI